MVAGCWEAMLDRLLERFRRWLHPECPVERAHRVMNASDLTAPLLSESSRDYMVMVDSTDDGLQGSLVFLSAEEGSGEGNVDPPSTPPLSPPRTPDLAAQPFQSYSDFLMRESVINQQLKGIDLVLNARSPAPSPPSLDTAIRTSQLNPYADDYERSLSDIFNPPMEPVRTVEDIPLHSMIDTPLGLVAAQGKFPTDPIQR